MLIVRAQVVLVLLLPGHLTNNDSIPKNADTTNRRVAELKKVATGKLILLVLDGQFHSLRVAPFVTVTFASHHTCTDVWDSQHIRAFECIDETTNSR